MTLSSTDKSQIQNIIVNEMFPNDEFSLAIVELDAEAIAGNIFHISTMNVVFKEPFGIAAFVMAEEGKLAVGFAPIELFNKLSLDITCFADCLDEEEMTIAQAYLFKITNGHINNPDIKLEEIAGILNTLDMDVPCDTHGCKNTGKLIQDPYNKEINDDNSYYGMCDGCYTNACESI